MTIRMTETSLCLPITLPYNMTFVNQIVKSSIQRGDSEIVLIYLIKATITKMLQCQ